MLCFTYEGKDESKQNIYKIYSEKVEFLRLVVPTAPSITSKKVKPELMPDT